MFSKPKIMDKLNCSHTSFKVDFHFKNNITLLMGDSGVGKTLVFSILKEASVDNEKLICFNYLDANKDILKELKNITGKLVVIDNADTLLTREIRKWIVFDNKNQYLIIGRNPADLLITKENLYQLVVIKKEEQIKFTLENLLERSDMDGDTDGSMG